MNPMRYPALLAATLTLAGCEPSAIDPSLGFLAGSGGEPGIGLVINSTANALTLFQLGDPDRQVQIPFGASDAITPVGFSLRGLNAAVPLGNAASVAIVDLREQEISRIFLFPGGNATGSAWTDDRTVLASNMTDDYVGRFLIDQPGDSIAQTVAVAPAPGTIVVHGGRAFVVSANLDENYAPLGNGVVTALDPVTLEVIGTVETGGTNPTDAAVGPDGLLYVVNTHQYETGSVTIIDPATLQVVSHVPDVAAGPGSIHINEDGLAFISGFFFGTLVLDTGTGEFVRGPENPVCAALEDGSCRGAPDAEPDANGNLYQLFFGSARKGLHPWVFRYRAGSYELIDSIGVGQGPMAIEIERFF
jgi:DNA-binding beta-propeller fold protein YncE